MIVRGIRALGRIWSRKWSFLGLFLLVFLLMVWLLAALDLLPDGPRVSAEAALATTTPALEDAPASVPEPQPQEPVKIEVKKIGLSATIANPDTTDIEALDKLLLKGAVRYPTSAKLNVDGNVVLFGHSSYLPIVKNLAYKTFDDIQKLKPGDTITVYSSDTAYTYAVRTVEKQAATSQVPIALQSTSQVLTLVTCNSFATKNDRFVVTADFVESHPLGV